jgi:capsular polysaccharide biosynthesis protein
MDIGVGQLLARTWRRIVGDGLAAKPAAPTLEATAGKRVAPADASTTQALALLDPGEQAQYLALEELIATRPWQFLYELVPFKEVLTSRLPVDDAFKVLRALLKLPASAIVEHHPVKSMADVSAENAIVFRETAPRGVAFTVQPPRIVGTGDQRPIECVTRSLYVACLPDACVRGRSSFVEFRGAELLDFQGEELDRVDDRFVLDLPVLQSTKEAVWISSSPREAMELDEAFNLLGPQAPQFGHWIWEYMPKYVAATMAAPEISGIPVLVDAHMPATHRECLEMVLPAGTEIIEVPPSRSVRVKRLWCAPRLFYIPLHPRTSDPSLIKYRTAPPDRFASAIKEMWRRMEAALPVTAGPERVFLARKSDQQRKLNNYAAIERLAKEAGFVTIYPQDLNFADQMRIVRNARFIVGQAGSALFLCFFARTGTRLCILSSSYVLRAASYTCLLQEIGVETTIITGSITREHDYPQFVDYSISEDKFQEFLKVWLSVEL